MTHKVYPTEADVGSDPATGQVMTESILTLLSLAMTRRPTSVKSGMALSAGTGLEVLIGTGSAYASGYLVEITVAESFTPAASENKVLYLRLDRTSTLVTGFTYVKTDSLTPIDDDHLLLGEYVTDGSGVTSVDMSEIVATPGYKFGRYTGDSTSSRTITVGFTPRFVIVQGDNTSLGEIVAISPLFVPGLTVPASGAPSLAFRTNPGATWAFVTSSEQRPEIVDDGFRVSYDAGLVDDNLNHSGNFYDYLAFA